MSLDWKDGVKENLEIRKGDHRVLLSFILAEGVLLFLLFIFSIIPYVGVVLAGVGQDNATTISRMDIGNSFPEVVNITINGGSSIDLTPNSTTRVDVVAVVRDYNGDGDIDSVTSEFFDNSASAYGNTDDNNNHYTNNTCVIDTSYGDASEANATCTFFVEYYGNNATWNATIFVNDSLSSSSLGSKTEMVNTLLALGLPDSLDYGLINATTVSDEKVVNVSNFGNVVMNLSLSGYAVTVGDGLAMNCTLGATQNISIEYEKYNLTNSTPGTLTLAEFDGNYTNLTSSVIVKDFNLNYRQNDTSFLIDDTNSTYWRIYVPKGVAGNCSGNIVFGAVQSAGT